MSGRVNIALRVYTSAFGVDIPSRNVSFKPDGRGVPPSVVLPLLPNGLRLFVDALRILAWGAWLWE